MKRDVWKDNCVNLVIRGAFEEVHGYRYIGNAIAALEDFINDDPEGRDQWLLIQLELEDVDTIK